MKRPLPLMLIVFRELPLGAVARVVVQPGRFDSLLDRKEQSSSADAGRIIEYEGGEVKIEDLVGDNRVTAMRGEIARLTPEAQYAIDARGDLGSVVSTGSDRRRPWLFGHRFVPEPPPAGHKLYLRTRYGDIMILKFRKPPTPAPLTHR